MSAPIVALEEVSKRFDRTLAVDRVSLEIQRGELFALLGGSGSGKTTLLRMLAGFEQPNGGRIRIDGADMTGVPPYARPVNLMFQSYALFPHLNVADNIAFGLRREGMAREKIRERVARMLSLVQLQGLGQRKPHQLSGGQRQRVALARALAKRPKLLLLDEPLGALDRKLREETQLELKRIQRELGTTFVVVTHDQEEAMTLADRVAVMRDGRILQVGAPDEVYEYPGSRYVADFVGSVNLFEGRLKIDKPDHAVLACEEAGMDILVGHGVTGIEGQTLWVAVRPEKLRLAREADPAVFNKVEGRVIDVAYRGESSTLAIELGGGKRLKAMQPNLQRWSDQPWRVGDTVVVGWAADAGVVLHQ